MFTTLLLSAILAAPATAPTPASAPAAANDLVLRPDEGLTFVREPGKRVEHPGFRTPNEPDCQVFREDGKIVYRMWWTTQRYEAQAKLIDKDDKPVFATCPSLVRTLDGRLRIYYDGDGIRSGVTP